MGSLLVTCPRWFAKLQGPNSAIPGTQTSTVAGLDLDDWALVFVVLGVWAQEECSYKTLRPTTESTGRVARRIVTHH